MRGPREAALAANRALYAAVEAGDLDAMGALWVEDREPVCVHLGAAVIRGRDAVLRSWAFVMASTDYVQFFLTDEVVTISDGVAVVTCTANALTGGLTSGSGGGPGATGSFEGGRAQALNVFAWSTDGWRLWVHQSSPVGSESP